METLNDMYGQIIDEVGEKAQFLMVQNNLTYLDLVIAMPNFIITHLKNRLNKQLSMDPLDRTLNMYGIRVVPHYENKVVIFYENICTSKNKENEKIEIEL